MAERVIRAVVADDHAVVRAGIRSVLEVGEGIEVVGEASDGAEAMALVAELSPDVLLLDVSMPGPSGLSVARRIIELSPDTSILVVSMHDDPRYVLEAMRAGALGYVLKDAPPSELREAVREVVAGGRYLPPPLAAGLGAALAEESKGTETARRMASLSEREREVLLLVADGGTSREIGEALGISHRTVETHRESVMAKLGIRTVAGLTRFVIEAANGED